MFIHHSQPTIGQSEVKAIAKALRSNYLSQGQLVRQFEESFGRFIGVKYALATNSGTSALHLSLLSLGIGPGDEVILPSYICSSVLNAVNYTRTKPVLVDINEDDFNISLADTRRKITKRTKAIIVPHLFGYAADIRGLRKLGIPIIEDCAHSIGATYQGKKLGSFGVLTFYSFYATKMMTTGYGGMVVSGDRRLLDKIRDLREFDNRDDYKPRYNCQMSDLAAGLGLVQLKRLPGFIRRRQAIARRYEQAFGFPGASHNRGVFFRYPVRVDDVNWAIKRLAGKGIEAKRPVYKPLHRYFGFTANGFPMTEKLYESTLSIPIYPALGDRQVDYVIKNTLEILKGAG